MPKKKRKTSSSSKKSTRRKTSTEHKHETPHREHTIEETLARNIVELQKVHATLAEKFDKLAKEISQLLALFELTARNFAKHAPLGEFEKDKEFLEKVDRLLEQNKTIAKGLTLMEERLRERVYGGPAPKEKSEEQPATQKSEESSITQGESVLREDEFRPSITTRNRPLPRF